MAGRGSTSRIVAVVITVALAVLFLISGAVPPIYWTGDEWQAIAGLLAVVVATAALFFSARTEARSEKRFDKQMAQYEAAEKRAHERFQEQTALDLKVAGGNVRPFLALVPYGDFRTRAGVLLHNYGVGPAIVKQQMTYEVHANFESKRALTLRSILNLDVSVAWDKEWKADAPMHVMPDKELCLMELSIDGLVAKGMPDQDASALFVALSHRILDVEFIIEYEDILGGHHCQRLKV